MRHRIILALMTFGWLWTSQALAQSVQNTVLAQELETLRKDFNAAGMSVVVVQDGDVILLEGFGLRDVENGSPVTPDTVFGLHSGTKSFTAAAMLRLEEQGKLDLDDKVRDHLPWFATGDEYISANMTLRDALSHRSGLPRTGMIYQGSGFSTEEAVRRLRFVDPVSPFRYTYTYQNLLYGMMDLIIEQKTGDDWSSYVQKHFLNALDMSRSSTGGGSLGPDRNYSKQYFFADSNNGALTEIPHNSPPAHDVSGPAGGVRTTARDLGEWLKYLLDQSGETKNAPLEYKALQQALAPHVVFRSPFYGAMAQGSEYVAYGLGWFLGEFNDADIAWHAGGGNGEITLVAFMPEKNLGVAVLSNTETDLPYAAVGLVFDRLTQGGAKDWYKEFQRFETSEDELAAQYKEYVDARIADTNPTLPLSSYAGKYTHEIYGDIVVKFEDGGLVMYRDNRVADLSHWHYDTFEARHRGLAVGFDTISFNIGFDGSAAEIIHFDVDGFYRAGTDDHH